MGLSMLGSSILARTAPGSALRDVAEKRIAGVNVPGKAVPGSLSRSDLEDPLYRQVPVGSNKVIAVKPLLAGMGISSPDTTPPLAPISPSIVEGIGLPEVQRPQVTSSNNNNQQSRGESRPSNNPSPQPQRSTPAQQPVIHAKASVRPPQPIKPIVKTTGARFIVQVPQQLRSNINPFNRLRSFFA